MLIITLLIACDTKPHVVQHSSPASDALKKNAVYVVSHEWHTGFVVPSKNLFVEVPVLKQRFVNSPNIEIGWGDKGFYQADEITIGLTMKAMFWPTDTVIHAVAVPNDIHNYFPYSEIEEIQLSDDQFKALIKFIVNSFYTDKKGKLKELKQGIYGNSQFYSGVGQFFLFNTCNNWTAKGLKSAGFDINTTFKLTKDSVLRYLEESKY